MSTKVTAEVVGRLVSESDYMVSFARYANCRGLCLTDLDARELVEADERLPYRMIEAVSEALNYASARSQGLVSPDRRDFADIARDCGVAEVLVPIVVSTATSLYNATTRIGQALAADIKWFLAYGADYHHNTPLDRIVLGGVFHKNEIDNMDNGFGLPVLFCPGGWGSSMSWLPAIPEWDEDLSSLAAEPRPVIESVTVDAETGYVIKAPDSNPRHRLTS